VIISIILITILAILIFSFFTKKKEEVIATQLIKTLLEPEFVPVITLTERFPIQIDNSGRLFRDILRHKKIPRRTYLYGFLRGKYWGDMDENSTGEQLYIKIYQFHIYEVSFEVEHTTGISTMPFGFLPDSDFPKEKLPKTIPCSVSIKGKEKEYEVVLYEPKFRKLIFVRNLQQEEGKEVFGTIETYATGYILDFSEEEYIEREYISNDEFQAKQLPNIDTLLTHTTIATGNIEYNYNYKRIEYFNSDFETTYWSNWTYNKPLKRSAEEGVGASLITLLGGMATVFFLLLLLPRLAILLPFVAAIILLRLIPLLVWEWLLRAIAFSLLLIFLIAIIKQVAPASQAYIPKPLTLDSISIPNYESVNNSGKANMPPDTLIKHYCRWRDYEGKVYEGICSVRKSDYKNASQFKLELSTTGSNEADYDNIIYRLKENDQSKLWGIYQLFDSLKKKNNLDSVRFSEMIVSFVQHIPYTLVLQQDCNPSLYSDNFIRNYLSSANARCDGFERFGINTPVEFMATFKGDCDTRTLLLYTIFTHYNYDVALMSSEYYNHSVIAIQLPFQGQAYYYKNKPYYFWETTSPGIPAGILAKEVSNKNHWRISLKSK
jgi:hypothetical protein